MAESEELRELGRDIRSLAEIIRANTDAINEDTSEQETNTEKTNASFKKLEDSVKKLGVELLKIADAGVKFGATIGTSATRGVQLELNNRASILAQIGRVEADRFVTLQQQQAAQQSLTDTFIGVREGMQLSAEGTKAFASNLKTGFRSEFQLTGESLRALTTIGATTAEQFDAFRQATGRASLSSGQLSTIVNKNSLSFLLFGNSFAKAAADAEKIGVSLSSIQSAQTGLVTNLDSTIDTVAQLNQLGAQVDFGTLTKIAEEQGPDALLNYLQATVPSEFFKSTSFRALFEQLGVSSEQLLRAGQVRSSADEMEAQMTQAATQTGVFADGLTLISRSMDVFQNSLTGLIIASGIAAASLSSVGVSGILSRIATAGGTVAAGSALPFIAGAAAVGLTGAAIYSSLATPRPEVATAPNLGAISVRPPAAPEGPNQYALVQKVDKLVDAIERANTTVTIDGTTKVMNRIGLVGVYSRNER